MDKVYYMPKLVAEGISLENFNKMKAHSAVAPGAANRPKIKITCVNVGVEVGPAKNRKQALTGVSATFGSARLTALMGPRCATKRYLGAAERLV